MKGGIILASTIRDVAARAGLSVGTVSKYINGKTVKENTRLAIEEAIKELDFHPNNIAMPHFFLWLLYHPAFDLRFLCETSFSFQML